MFQFSSGFRRYAALLSACFAYLYGPELLAQNSSAFPDRPIRLLVGFAPGSGSDTIARLIAPRLGEGLGQPVVVENRIGAGGQIASEALAKALPDGYTLALFPSGHSTQAVMRKTLPFDPVTDFSWVSTITTYPMLIGVAPDSPYKSLADALQAAKNSAGKISYSSGGTGSGHHLIGEWLNSAGKVEMTHIPFKGGSLAATEVMAGRVDIMIETMTLALPMVRSGQIRALAVSSSQPLPTLPNVPTIGSLYPEIQYDSWLGIVGPAKLPSQVLQRLNQEIRKVLAQPDIERRLAELGGQASPSSPEAFRDRVVSDITKFRHIIAVRKIERE